jgi:hypothetical protein
MSDPHVKDVHQSLDNQPDPKQPERRTQARSESVLSQIEDATYAALRKHDKQSA